MITIVTTLSIPPSLLTLTTALYLLLSVYQREVEGMPLMETPLRQSSLSIKSLEHSLSKVLHVC